MRFFLWAVMVFFSVQLIAQESIKIGVLPFNPPFSMQSNIKGDFVGFEVSIMDEICKRMKVTCVYEPKLFNELFPALDKNELHLAIGAIIITDERKKKFLFTLPYLVSEGQLVVVKGTFNKPSELITKRIGTIEGTIYEQLIQSHFENNATISTYNHPLELFDKLIKRELDAVLMDKKASLFWVASHPRLRIIGKDIDTGMGYAFMTNKSNKNLIEQMNKILLEMEEDGTYMKIYHSYFNK